MIPGSSSGLLILLVDDDRIYQFTAKRMIALTGLSSNTVVCSNGLEAIRYLQQVIAQAKQLPDIIFLDINMPVMNGWQFLQQLATFDAAQLPEIPVCMVSSSVDVSDINKARQFAAVKEYITKPASKEKYQQVLLRVCGPSTLNIT